MKIKDLAQADFSSVLFDTLFGLILFFGLDSFLDIQDKWHFIFYLLATVVVVHWWLLFKSADDAFGDEVNASAVDLVFGVIYIILIDYVILLAKIFNYQASIAFLIALLAADLVWALAWRFVGKWNTKDSARIRAMESELEHTIGIDIVGIVTFSVLLYFAAAISAPMFIGLAVVFYLSYILLSFSKKVIDLKIF